MGKGLGVTASDSRGFCFKEANFGPVSVNSSIVRFFIQFPRDMSLWKADKRWNSFLECGRSLYNSCKGNANVQVSLAAVINPDRHLCLPLFSCFGREDSAPSSSPCPCAHNVGKTGEEAFPCCPPVWGMWVEDVLWWDTEPSLQLPGARGDSPAAFSLCPALCSPHPRYHL